MLEYRKSSYYMIEPSFRSKFLPNIRQRVPPVPQIPVVILLQVPDGTLLGLHFHHRRVTTGDGGFFRDRDRRGGRPGPLSFARSLGGERRRRRLHVSPLLVADVCAERQKKRRFVLREMIFLLRLRVFLFGYVLEMRRGLTCPGRTLRSGNRRGRGHRLAFGRGAAPRQAALPHPHQCGGVWRDL